MNLKSKKLKDNFFNLGAEVANLRLILFEWLYSAHIQVRYLHDKNYAKGGTYKDWSDKRYSSAVHKAVLIGFIVSFLFFLTF